MGRRFMMDRYKRLLFAASGIFVLLAVLVASWLFMASHTPAGESKALSDASLASQRASAGARLVGAARNEDRVGTPAGR